jgi:hypothetical protein
VHEVSGHRHGAPTKGRMACLTSAWS